VKALLHYRASPDLQERLSARAPDWLRTVTVDEADRENIARELVDTDVLLHVLEPVTRELMAVAPRLRLIQKIGVGVNTIDLVEAKRRGIRVANMPGTNSQAVCEMALALLLAALRKVIPFDAATRRGEGWILPPGSTDDVTEVHGKTVGLVGYGEVPRRLAPVLQALGARVLAFDLRTPGDGIAQPATLDELLAVSDIVSLHLPLTEETRHLLNRDTLGRMKRGVVLVNTARGGLIEEAALVEALRSGHVRAAGLDVFDREPLSSGNPLLSLANVVVMPHLSWLTAETLERSFAVAMENCTRLRDGADLRNEILLP